MGINSEAPIIIYLCVTNDHIITQTVRITIRHTSYYRLSTLNTSA